jgi:superfamily I DNA and/or RNA helicase
MSNVEETIHKNLSDNGFLSSNGSIMKMAQNACDILDPLNKLKERGMMLVEHRRCYDEIIAYCNDLAYEGMLKPMKGKAISSSLFAPMLLIHSEGGSQVNNKDRSNEVEAEHIKKWLITNRSKIEDHYNRDKSKSHKTVEDVIGIITPFKGQKRLLVNKLKSAGFQVSKMKIGTVHALQGAEREIILFSSVYDEGDVSVMFFDRDNKPNILNVAVSRAKESFIVFGNERIFNPKSNTPSGKLIKYLEKSTV